MGIGCRRRGDKVGGWRDRVQTHGAVNVCTADGGSSGGIGCRRSGQWLALLLLY